MVCYSFCTGLFFILYGGHQLNPTGYFQIRIITAATCILEKSHANPCKALLVSVVME